jgi:hypothetical protein
VFDEIDTASARHNGFIAEEFDFIFTEMHRVG